MELCKCGHRDYQHLIETGRCRNATPDEGACPCTKFEAEESPACSHPYKELQWVCEACGWRESSGARARIEELENALKVLAVEVESLMNYCGEDAKTEAVKAALSMAEKHANS